MFDLGPRTRSRFVVGTVRGPFFAICRSAAPERIRKSELKISMKIEFQLAHWQSLFRNSLSSCGGLCALTVVQNFIRDFGSTFRKPKFGSLNPGALAPEVFPKTENLKNIFSKIKK